MSSIIEEETNKELISMLRDAYNNIQTKATATSGLFGYVATQPQPWPNGINRPSQVFQGVIR